MTYKRQIALMWCAAAAFAPSTLAVGLSAQADIFFEDNGIITCKQSSGGGFGIVNAPLIGCIQTFGQSEIRLEGAASVEFGTLRVFGSTSATNLNVPAGSTGLAWFDRVDANISDTLTISHGSFLDLTLVFSGTESNAGALFFVNGADVPYTFPGPNIFRLPFRPGIPFSLNEDLRVDLGNSLSPDQPQGQSFAQYVDFSHTVQIVSAQVFDSQGNPVSNATITSASGFDYSNPLGSSDAPEPGSIGLVVVGMALMCGGKVTDSGPRQGRPWGTAASFRHGE